MKGSSTLFALAAILVVVLGGTYLYVDTKADSKANAIMKTLMDDTKEQGAELSYSSVDASPISQSVEINDFVILGQDQEPDIRLGKVQIKGFSWQDLNNKNQALPTEINVDIENGAIDFNKSSVPNNSDLEALVAVFGQTISFSTQFSYQHDVNKNLLNLSFIQTVEDNFVFDGELNIGNVAWLKELTTKQTKLPDALLNQAIKSSLNKLSLVYKNDGIIEKIRSLVSDKSGKTNKQLVEESIAQLQQLKMLSASNWGPVFTPLIDEMIKFSHIPKQLKLDIDPKQPLTGQDFMMAFMGGETSLVQLLENAQITLKAN
jgi:hypothetical protein